MTSSAKAYLGKHAQIRVTCLRCLDGDHSKNHDPVMGCTELVAVTLGHERMFCCQCMEEGTKPKRMTARHRLLLLHAPCVRYACGAGCPRNEKPKRRKK